MYKVIFTILLLTINQASVGELKEFACEAIYSESGNSELKIMSLPDFSMLDYNSENEFVKLNPPEGVVIKALRCERSSIVPNKYDYMALRAGYPFYIMSNSRGVVIELYKGQFRIRLLKGAEFTEAEAKETEAMLNFFQSQLDNL